MSAGRRRCVLRGILLRPSRACWARWLGSAALSRCAGPYWGPSAYCLRGPWPTSCCPCSPLTAKEGSDSDVVDTGEAGCSVACCDRAGRFWDPWVDRRPGLVLGGTAAVQGEKVDWLLGARVHGAEVTV